VAGTRARRLPAAVFLRRLTDPLAAAGQRDGAEARARREREARWRRSAFLGTFAILAGLLGWIVRDAPPPQAPAGAGGGATVVASDRVGGTTWTDVRVVRADPTPVPRSDSRSGSTR
jgi:hypothetical protein